MEFLGECLNSKKQEGGGLAPMTNDTLSYCLGMWLSVEKR